MTATKKTPAMRRVPKVGDRVRLLKPYRGFTTGRVAEVLDGACGPILGLHLDGYPGATVDTYWRKVVPA